MAGHNVYVSGIYYDTLQSLAGCDSIISIDLTINNSVNGDTTTTTACDSLVWYGNTYTSTGTYTDTLQTTLGCDSVVTLILTVNSSPTGDTTAVACDSLVWYGNTYTTTGTYTDTLQTATGCDSVVTLNLTINNATTGDTTAIACDSLVWYGNTYTSTGTYTDTLQTVSGCDSVVTLNLTINSATTGDTTAIACDSLVWYGTTYTTTGTYTDTLQTTSGCDSVVTLNLTVVSPPIVYAGLDDTICSGESVTLNSQVLWNPNHVQDPALTACTDGSSIRIRFNEANNCSSAPGDLSGMTEIGFHSGTDNWSTVVAWDSPNAVTATNIGKDIFEVVIDPLTYYGLGAMPSNIGIVYNQGATVPSNPWGSEGKSEGNGGCQDFFINPASLPTCSTDPITVSWDNGVSDGVSFSPTSTSDYVLTGSNTPGCTSTDTVIDYGT